MSLAPWVSAFLSPVAATGVALGHVGADCKDGVGLLHIHQRVGHCASSDLGRQTGDRGSVSSTRAVIDMMRPEAGSDEFLHRVGRFVRSAAGGDTEDTMATVFLFGLGETFGCFFESFIPFYFFKGAVLLFDKRLLRRSSC